MAFAGGMAAGLKTGTLNFEEVQDILEAMFLLCSPIIVMAVPNMFLYGKIICVVNKEDSYFENDFIPLDEIDSITYDLKLPARRGAGYRCAIISAGVSLMERRSFNVW